MQVSKNTIKRTSAASLVDLFDSAAEKFSLLPAVEFGTEQLSYSQLQERANQLASYLMEKGITPGAKVAVCLSRSTRVPWTILGILKAGAAYLPLDPEYPSDRLSYMLENSGAKVLITESIFIERLPRGQLTTLLLDKQEQEIFEKINVTLPSISPENTAYLIYTSGSTGKPKGVVMPHKVLVNLILWQAKDPRLGRAAKTLQFTPLSFDVHFQEFFGTWTTGGCLVFISEDERLDAIKLLQFLHNKEIERLYLPFIALQSLSEVASGSTEEKFIPSKLRDVITAGEQLQISNHIRKFFSLIPKCKLHNHYGPSETHVVTAYTLTGPPNEWPPLPSIGSPISNCSMFLLDENQKRVNDGEEGELYIGGSCVADGYIGLEELSLKSFIPDLSSISSDTLYRTGDLVKQLPDGNFQFFGRKDGQIKIRGYRIELAEIELALTSHPYIGNAVVTVRNDSRGNKSLVAYLTKEKSSSEFSASTPGTTSLRGYLKDKIPEYMIPGHYSWMESFPRTPSGKVDRKSLPAIEATRPKLEQQYIKPIGPTEELLSNLWRELLQIDRIGALDNLFDLGANSLLCIQCSAKLYQNNDIEIPVAVIFQEPTIRAISQYLANTSPQSNSLRVSPLIRNNLGDRETKVAIIGMAGRFPGAKNVSELWHNLRMGLETTSYFTEEELDPAIDEALRGDDQYVRARGVMQDADMFDASFFGIGPMEAQMIDPQQRIFLEISHQALENAGYSSRTYDGEIGVFAGSHNNSYYQSNIQRRPDLIMRFGEFQTMVANEKDYITTRVAHKLNCKGPALSVYTACSTSLVATALAVENLLNYECDMALAGGVAITVPQYSGYLYQEGAMLSKDGHCRPFDEEATGTVFSDGAGVVLLKRLSDALRDGDHITAVISGAALNNDGSDKMSFSAPSIDAQANVIAKAQARADVSADSISYIEAHGTATPLGDPIEVTALTKVFREDTNENGFCAIGSIKSNFGHLTAAAGIAGLLKVALSLKNEEIPPTLHYKKPNKQIDFAQSPFYVNTELLKWQKGAIPRRAGVSSFGVGGTNCHIILEEAPASIPNDSEENLRYQLIPFSARSTEALDKAIENFQRFLGENTISSLSDIAFTLQKGREHFKHRRVYTCEDIDRFKEVLSSSTPSHCVSGQVSEAERSATFLFPGQGSQYAGMGLGIYQNEPIFAQVVDSCADILKEHLKEDIRTVLFTTDNQSLENAEKLKQTKYNQPALFTVEYALSKLWMSWGLKPNAMVGHSIGEFVCACLSGVINLEDSLRLVAARGALMQKQPTGSMLSVRSSASKLAPLLSENVTIASINAPSLCTVSGTDEDILAIQKRLEEEGLISKLLHTSHAFHSSMMDSAVDPFYQIASSVSLSPPTIPFVSTVTGTWITDTEAVSPEYWASQLRRPVLFSQAITTLFEEEEQIILEVGPRATLATLTRQHPQLEKKHKIYSSLGGTAGEEEYRMLLMTYGKLWTEGASLDWKAISKGNQGRRIPLPTYAFEYKRYWVDTEKVTKQKQPEDTYREENINNNEDLDMAKEIETRIHRLIPEVQQVFEEVSGMEIVGTEADTDLLDLGVDSLTLTQAALFLAKRFSITVTFRQLMDELRSCHLLAQYIDKHLPPEPQTTEITTKIPPQSIQQRQSAPASAPIAPVNITPSPSPHASQNRKSNVSPVNVEGSTSLLGNVITRQMALMERQIELLAGSGAGCAASPIQEVVSPVEAVPMPEAEKETISEPERKGLSILGLDPSPPVKKPSEPSENKDNSVSYGSTAPRRAFGAAARIRIHHHDELNEKQRTFFNDLLMRYENQTKESKKQTQQHRSYFADPRTVSGFTPLVKEFIYPIVTQKSEGAQLWDVDGNEYIDLLGGFGSNLFGNRKPFIIEAIQQQLNKGMEIGPQNPLAGQVAKLVCELTGMERATFCNTGSEAVLGTMRVARTVTGKDTIVIFEGAYHGILDEVIVRGGKNLNPFPAAAGVPSSAVKNMLVLEYGNPKSLAIIKSKVDQIAGVLVESVQSRRPDFQPREFLQNLRQVTQDINIPLIFDECITGFRIHPGGAQAHFGVKADLASYGKIAGGGMPFGIVAGRKDYLDAFDGGFWNYGDTSKPEKGVTYYAGTFTRHPLALAASHAVLSRLKKEGPGLQEKLNTKANAFVAELNGFFNSVGAPLHLAHFGSLMNLTFTHDEPFSELLYVLLRLKGIFIWDARPSFLTLAHTEKDIETIIAAIKEAVTELQEAEFI